VKVKLSDGPRLAIQKSKMPVTWRVMLVVLVLVRETNTVCWGGEGDVVSDRSVEASSSSART
jgi:hypothetical protein